MAERSSVGYVDLILTAGCNLACSYCYQNAKQPGRNMDRFTVEKAVDLLLASPRREVKLGLYGGEPLLRFDLIRHAVDYAERKKRRGQRVRYGLITNGTLLDEERAAFLARHDVDTRISFDGVQAAQRERGARTFPALDGLLERLRASHPLWFEESVQISATVTPGNFRYLAASVAYFLAKDVRTIRFSPQVTDTSSWRVEQIHDLRAQMDLVFASSLRQWERTGVVAIADFRRAESGEDVHAPRGRAMCGAPTGEAVAVDVDGRAYGCVMFAESYQRLGSEFLRGQVTPLGLGDIAAQGFSMQLRLYPTRARSSPIFHRKQDKRSSYRACGDCEFLQECSICPVSIGNIPHTDDPHRVPDFLCAWNLVINDCRKRFPAQPTVRDVLIGRAHVPKLLRELRAHVESSESSRARRVP